jgi:hypothetical protein
MDQLIEQQLAAEEAHDPAGSVAMYTDDVIHYVVGSPLGVLEGPTAAREFYDWLNRTINTEQIDVNHAWYGDDFL